MDEIIFVERQFKLGEHPIIARFHLPTLEPGGEFKCSWTIDWPEHTERRSSRGIDSVQALLLAMQSVHSQLVSHEGYRAGKLTYLNEKVLDLPPHFLPTDTGSSEPPSP